MALPTNNSRPAIPYVPTQVLPNYDRYESLGQFPPTAQQLDGDLNKMIDLINTLSDEINHVVVGALPGADDPLNANSLMTTDGAGNISWVKAASANLDDGAVTTVKIANAAITSEKIQPQAVDTDQLAISAVTTPKIANKNVTLGKLIGNRAQGVLSDDGSGTISMTQTYAQSEYIRLLAGGPASVTGKTWPLGFFELPDFWKYSRPNSCSGTILTDKTITKNKIDNVFAQSLAPTGCVMPFAGLILPDGWFSCNGQEVSRQTYSALFAVIGTTYGAGDGSTTFNVPDLRGRAMFGFVSSSTAGLITTATADKVALGGKGGEETHVLTTAEMPSHSHLYYPLSGGGTTNFGSVYGGGNQAEPRTTSPVGNDNAHNNMPPFLLMNFIIKT